MLVGKVEIVYESKVLCGQMRSLIICVLSFSEQARSVLYSMPSSHNAWGQKLEEAAPEISILFIEKIFSGLL